jgi:hypothetical protein
MKTFTKSLLIFFFAVAVFSVRTAHAQDTINVQTFFYGSSQDSFFLFPPDTNRYEKILMHYKLRCNPAQSPACGEWDYLTYSFLWDHTGVNDSTLTSQPSYTIDGNSPDSIQFMTSPSYTYFPVWQTHIVYDSLISMDTAAVGSGSVVSAHPFSSAQPQSRTQYLWKASELLAAGMQAGNITSLRFNLQSAGSAMQNLFIRMKHSSLDSLTATSFERSGLALTFSDDVIFSSAGWQTINLTYPFNWNGTSNLVIDIAYTNTAAGTDNSVLADNTTFPSGVFSSGDDRSLFWNGADHAQIPSQAFAQLDSFVTVAFWCYGNPAFQPQDQSFIEGFDVNNRRVINIHLPWSNSNVYWDAGNSGTLNYDRLNIAAASSSFMGQWNHWAFTKNVATGRMKIYLNGTLLTQATGKTRRMFGITNFKLGSAWNGNIAYDGNIEEFAMWNAELDTATIRAYMYKDLDAGHPFNSNLLLYYHCNDQSFSTITDAGTGAFNGALAGPPSTRQIGGENLFRNFQSTTERPNIVFEQGVYVSHLDSVLVVDSVANDPFTIIQYNNTGNPTVPTDTIVVWAAYYNQYQYDSTGTAVDSMFVTPDSTFYLVHHPYYNVFEVINRYEIGRFITPYGNGLNLGTGFTWTYDVTDYASLLHDTVHLSAGNWQELLDVRFEMIRGIPPRDAYKVDNLWVGNPQLYNIENFLTPKTVFIDSAAVNTRYKMRTTGHWFGGPENCAEFCIKHNYLFVDGIQRWDTIVWKNDCSLNPLYPQGGTWIYNRANWCPGADVPTYDFELTPYVTPNDSATLDYNVQPYTGGGGPNYVIETQLISYTAPNFTLDAGVWDIKAPSKADVHKRMNPICTRPIVTIRNGGTTPLTSLTLTYGIENGPQSVYNWTGNLDFLKTADVTLPPFAWSSGNNFMVTLSNPNGGADQYANNNTMKSTYNIPPQYDSVLVFDLLTDLHYDQFGFNQGSYTIKDENGNIVHQRNNLSPSTLYKDTVHFAPGCYEFRFKDDVAGITDFYNTDYNFGDGMTTWPDQTNVAGHMWIKRATTGAIVKSFGMDFGREMYQQFTIGFYVSVPEPQYENIIGLYPNPSTGMFYLDMTFPVAQDVTILITDVMGKKIYEASLKNVQTANEQIDLSRQPNGIYFAVVQSKDKRIVRKLIKHK